MYKLLDFFEKKKKLEKKWIFFEKVCEIQNLIITLQSQKRR